jgi:hypothetical protein
LSATIIKFTFLSSFQKRYGQDNLLKIIER